MYITHNLHCIMHGITKEKCMIDVRAVLRNTKYMYHVLNQIITYTVTSKISPPLSAPLIISLTMNHEWCWASWLIESTAATASYLLPCCSWPWYFNIWFLIASVALWVLGIRNLSCSVTTAASPAPVPNLNVMMSGFFFLAVILSTVSSLWRCFTLAQPALSDSSRRTSRLSGVRRIWLHVGDGALEENVEEREREGKEGKR